eukprot:6601414-Prymnesium_polylepis.1
MEGAIGGRDGKAWLEGVTGGCGERRGRGGREQRARRRARGPFAAATRAGLARRAGAVALLHTAGSRRRGNVQSL